MQANLLAPAGNDLELLRGAPERGARRGRRRLGASFHWRGLGKPLARLSRTRRRRPLVNPLRPRAIRNRPPTRAARRGGRPLGSDSAGNGKRDTKRGIRTGLELPKPGYFSHGGSNPGYACRFLGHATAGCGAVLMANSEHGPFSVSGGARDDRARVRMARLLHGKSLRARAGPLPLSKFIRACPPLVGSSGAKFLPHQIIRLRIRNHRRTNSPGFSGFVDRTYTNPSISGASRKLRPSHVRRSPWPFDEHFHLPPDPGCGCGRGRCAVGGPSLHGGAARPPRPAPAVPTPPRACPGSRE